MYTHAGKLCIYVFIVLFSVSAYADTVNELSVLKENFRKIYVLSDNDKSGLQDELLANQPGFVISDRVVMELQQRVPYDRERALSYIEGIRPDGSWWDIDYQDTRRSGWDPRLHAERILELVRYFLNPRNELFLSGDVGNVIHKALDYWFSKRPVCSNWYYNEIGVPRTLGTALVLFERHLTRHEKAEALELLKVSEFGKTGQNKVWLAANVMMRGLLENNIGLVKQARDTIASEITFGGSEGIQYDWCFHQHGVQQQFGNYGLAYAYTMSLLSGILAGTSLAFSDEQLDTIASLLENGYQWIIWRGKMDINALGRQLFPSAPLHKALSLAFAATGLGGGKNEKCNVTSKRLLENCFSEHHSLVGHKHFWLSDYSVCRREKWMASLKMASQRVTGVESMNGDNMNGYYMADGALYVYRTSMEYYDIFPLWDWRKIPGITCYENPSAPVPALADCYYPKNRGTYVGGLSDGRNGISVMELDRDGLKALKFWLFADSAVVCLGSGITSDSILNVTTTIEQCRSRGGCQVLEGDDVRVLHNGIGYIIWDKQGGGYTLKNEMANGCWYDVMRMYGKEPVEGKVFTLYLNHGRKVDNAGYCYAVVPETNMCGLRSFNTGNYRIVRNDSIMQVVYVEKTRICWASVKRSARLELTSGLSVKFGNCGLYKLDFSEEGICRILYCDPLQVQPSVSVEINHEKKTVALPSGRMKGTPVRFIMRI